MTARDRRAATASLRSRLLESRAARWWFAIREPRVVKALYWCVYLVVLLTGVVTLVSPPTTIAEPLGPVLSQTWSVFWIVSGTAGLMAVFPGWWKAERSAIGLAMTGNAIYAAVLIILQVTAAGSRLTQLGWLAVAALLLTIRLVTVRGHDYEPRS